MHLGILTITITISASAVGCAPAAVLPETQPPGLHAASAGDTSELRDAPPVASSPAPQEPSSGRSERAAQEPIDAYLDPDRLADGVALQREHEAQRAAELAAQEAAREEQRQAERATQAQSVAEREALRLAVLEHVVGRTWLCTEPDHASALVRIESRAPRRAVDDAVIDAGWILLHVQMFYGDGDTGLLPGAEERFVQTVDADSLMRIDQSGSGYSARIVFSDWGLFWIRDVMPRSFTLIGAVSTRGVVSGTRTCAPAPRGRR